MKPDFSTTSTEEIIQWLGAQIYSPAFSSWHDDILILPEVLRIFVLIVDFDTEVVMNGILGFLENSSGRYLRETAEAFEIIGALQTASVLHEIERILNRHGVTWERLRGDFSNRATHQISTFAELHGDDSAEWANEVHNAARALYTNQQISEPVFELLERYMNDRRPEFVSVLEQF